MSDLIIETPLPGADAFAGDDDLAAWSQAAQMVGLGLQLTGESDLLWGEEGNSELDIPAIRPLGVDFPADHAEFVIQDHFRQYLPFSWRQYPGWARPLESRMQSAPPLRYDKFSDLERRLAPALFKAIRAEKERSEMVAATLLHVAQFSSHEIVRVAAAASVANLGPRLSWPTIEVLADGCTSEDEDVQQIAVDAMLRTAPGHPVLRNLKEGQEPDEGGESVPAHTSITVPGTWGRYKKPSWWRPGDPLFSYLQVEPGVEEPASDILQVLGGDLYTGDDYYRWLTDFSSEDRLMGAKRLADWASRQGVASFSKIFAHSHGGNVVLDAAARHQVRTDLLVMIATPPHYRGEVEWDIIKENVHGIVSIRPFFDIVVMLDRWSSRLKGIPVKDRFPTDRVVDLRPRVWFRHGALTRPKIWRKHNLASEVAAEYKEFTYGAKRP
jgi:pimeloyl-ACP methyl ester carboxylesterase